MPRAGTPIEEVLVTARLREERLQDIPVAATVVSAEDIARYGAADLTQISKMVPQLIVGRQATGSSVNIYLRGVGSSSLSAGFDQSVSLALDGVSMTRGREIISSQFDLSQVEVLRGPQALFFGRNATGGIISIATANPTPVFEASAKVGYEFGAAETFGEAVVSGPLTDDLGVRFALRGSRMAGYSHNTAEPMFVFGELKPGAADSRGPRDTSIAGRLTLKYDPTDNFDATLKVSANKYTDSGAMARAQTVCAPGRTVPQLVNGIADPGDNCVIDSQYARGSMQKEFLVGSHYFRDGKPYTDYTSQLSALTMNYTLDKVRLTSITGFYHYGYDDNNNFDGSPSETFTAQAVDYKSYSQELRADFEVLPTVRVLVGGFYGYTDFFYGLESRFLRVAPDPVTGSQVSFYRHSGTTSKTLSAFTEVAWDILPDLELAGGARWTQENKDFYTQNLYSVLPATFPPRRLDGKFNDSNVSPQATLTWRAMPNLTVYGAYKQGFKSGGYNNSATVTSAVTIDQMRFESEKAAGGEIGIKGQLLDSQLQLGVTLYNYAYTDLQVNIYDPFTATSFVSNAGQLTTRGVELEGEFSPADLRGFTLRGSVAFNNATLHDYIGACYGGQSIDAGCNLNINGAGAYNSQNFENKTAARAPKWSMRLGALYAWDMTSTLTSDVSLDLGYTSSYNYHDGLRPSALQKGFPRVDASWRVSSGNEWAVSLIGRNLSNELVAIGAQDRTGTGGNTGRSTGYLSDMNVMVDRGREIMLQYAYNF
ncbi:MAG TPA: TonB-dependent receptor [Rhizomicrobium sp.]|nr:TonB-dependent receptor [Rhizomicrobium sp.]